MSDFETVPRGTMDRLRAVEQERDALSAHVVAGREAVEHARQWVPQHVWTELWLWKENSPETSLARMIAEKQAESLDNLCVDEGCPHHGTPHVCVNHQKENDHGTS